MSYIETPTSVVARLLNENAYAEGVAAGAVEFGTAVVPSDYDEGEQFGEIATAGANASTRYIAREQRNPPRNDPSTALEAVLNDAYDDGDWTEAVGFNRHDRARVRLSEHASADPVGETFGWDENGYATDDTVDGSDPVETTIGEVLTVFELGDEDWALVEFR